MQYRYSPELIRWTALLCVTKTPPPLEVVARVLAELIHRGEGGDLPWPEEEALGYAAMLLGSLELRTAARRSPP